MIDSHHIQQHRDLAPVVSLMIKPVEKCLPCLFLYVLSLVILVLDHRMEMALIQFIDKLYITSSVSFLYWKSFV